MPLSKEHVADPGILTNLPAQVRWGLLVLVTVPITGLLEWWHIPAALLMGPMLTAILFATNGARLNVSRIPYIAAHSLVGCVIARSLDPGVIPAFLDDWPIFIAVVLSVIGATSVFGYLLARAGALPGTTGVWGTSAGGASAMVLMAEAHGADARLVAFMQYLRVVAVAASASLVAAFIFHASGEQSAPIDWWPPVDWIAFTETIVVAISASALGAALKIPAGTMLLPMIALTILKSLGLIEIELPIWLLAAGYGVLGWRIGLGFTRRILRHAANALPQIALSIVVLLAFSGLLAIILWKGLGIDPMTAYLATSPGGLDSIAIIAASTPVDISFVMALQTVRFVLVLLLGGPIAKFVARRLPA